MAETTILVPIRFPLTEQSTQTLVTAGRLARDNAPVNRLGVKPRGFPWISRTRLGYHRDDALLR
jgi:hypothetical protein